MTTKFTMNTQDAFGKITFHFYSLKDFMEWFNKNANLELEEIKNQAILHFKDVETHR